MIGSGQLGLDRFYESVKKIRVVDCGGSGGGGVLLL